MDQATYDAVDAYVEGLLAPADEALEAALAATAAAGIPAIQVSAAQGKLLGLLARAIGARRVLEFGTLAAYSTIWLGRALPADGRIVTLERNPEHAAVARENFERAGLGALVDLRVGAAFECLAELDRERMQPFDLTFIDADKVNTPGYYEWALAHSRPGALILADNSIRGGDLVDAGSRDPAAAELRRFHEIVAADPRVEGTTIQTVGVKGYDGFTLVRVADA